MDQSCRTFPRRAARRSAPRQWLVLGMLLGVLGAWQGTAKAGEVQFTTESSQGLKLVSVNVPVCSDGNSPGSWSLLRLHFDREGSSDPIHVTITEDGSGSWGAFSTPGPNPDEVDVVVPDGSFFNSWRYSTGEPTPPDSTHPSKGLLTHLHFSAEAGDKSTSGLFVHRSWEPLTRVSSSDLVCVNACDDNNGPAGGPFHRMDQDDVN
ncbi:MAG: hypothetical protein M3Y56_01100, partial [Armatimonadota bacterium]|nr:hypothetical protein [Armatimonadota bacterium]